MTVTSYFAQYYNSLGYPIADEEKPGLRMAQLGAIHSIAAHLTLDTRPGLIVLPTGAGKTAVLMMTAYVARSQRVLVITPSRLVRSQIAEDFDSLTTLKKVSVFDLKTKTPKVREVTSTIGSTNDWEQLRQYNVIVSTPNAISPALAGIPPPPTDLFDLLLIDEAHHSPAKTWNSVLSSFSSAHRFLFTATPFRRDKKEIEGKLIYSYPIREAYKDKIFGDIEYVPVYPDSCPPDVAVAKETERIFQEDRAKGLAHLVMVRTDSKTRALELKKVYEEHTNLRLQSINSSHTLGHIKKAITTLRKQELDGIICVDMLGEGFDLPNLKIAAIHAPHKSLEVTLQFIGRFARTGPEKLGKARFLAVPSEIQIETERLYEEGAVWQDVVQNLSHARIQREQDLRESIEKFDAPAIVTDDTDDLSLFALRPYFHVKIYRVQSPIDVTHEIEMPPAYEIIFKQVNHEQSTVVFITKETQKPQWTHLTRFNRSEYDLFVIHYHDASQLLFINSSRRTFSVYEDLARQYSGDTHRILSLSRINQILADLEHPEFFNIGMKNSQLNSRAESYRIITGSSAQNAINETDGRMYHRGHVFGKAMTKGVATTIGYSSASKVWSHKYAQIPELITWFSQLAHKLCQDKSVVTGSGLDHLSVGQEIVEFPSSVIAAEWDPGVFRSPIDVEYLKPDGSRYTGILTNLELQIDHTGSDATHIRFTVVGPELTASGECSISPTGLSFSIDPTAPQVLVSKRSEQLSLAQYLKAFPPSFYFSDFSRVQGIERFLFASNAQFPFDLSRIKTFDWIKENVDITCEFRGTHTKTTHLSVHDFMREKLRSDDDNSVVIYDHRSGEIADFISFRTLDNEQFVTFYHCKGSGEAQTGERVRDVYEVCGQVVKSIRWFVRPDVLQTKLRSRISGGSILIKGNRSDLPQIFSQMLSRRVRYQVVLVQPGISCSEVTEKTAYIFAAANDYLLRAQGEPIAIWASA